MPGLFRWTPGWLGVDETQKYFARQFGTLTETAPQLMQAPVPDDKPILLYKAWTDIFADYPPWAPQTIGDCVSHGSAHGNDLLECIEIVMGIQGGPRTAADVQETDSEFIYGESRKVAGILGRQDGSYGAAAVKAMMTVGMVSRQMLGTNGAYSGDRAKEWGYSGPPADVEKMAGAYKLGNAALVGTWDELVAAIYDGKPVIECSNWLPDGKRDKNGFGGNGGRGGHCQLICGVRFDIPGAFILNNWPLDFYSGPIGLGAPRGGQWVPQSTIEDILGEGDSWALSASPSFGSGSAGIHAPLPTSWRHA